MTWIRVEGVHEEIVSHLPVLILAKNMVYRRIPNLIYPVKHHDKDSGGRFIWRICFTFACANSCKEHGLQNNSYPYFITRCTFVTFNVSLFFLYSRLRWSLSWRCPLSMVHPSIRPASSIGGDWGGWRYARRFFLDSEPLKPFRFDPDLLTRI